VQFVRGDICDPRVVEDAIAGQDVVFHSASLVHTKHNRLETVRAVNIDGTRNVLRACQQSPAPRLVYVSSASVVYDGSDIENGDESLPYAPSFPAPYAETKRIAEEEVLAASGQRPARRAGPARSGRTSSSALATPAWSRRSSAAPARASSSSASASARRSSPTSPT
jgi:nucleoside-diphosphate-sugar epimerase